MERPHSLLRTVEEGRAIDRLNGYDTRRRDKVIGAHETATTIWPACRKSRAAGADVVVTDLAELLAT
jgi:hypothetical protein